MSSKVRREVLVVPFVSTLEVLSTRRDKRSAERRGDTRVTTCGIRVSVASRVWFLLCTLNRLALAAAARRSTFQTGSENYVACSTHLKTRVRMWGEVLPPASPVVRKGGDVDSAAEYPAMGGDILARGAAGRTRQVGTPQGVICRWETNNSGFPRRLPSPKTFLWTDCVPAEEPWGRRRRRRCRSTWCTLPPLRPTAWRGLVARAR